MSVITVDNISFGYQNETLFKGASMRLFEGEHACLVGANGSGKSTLMRLLNGDLKPDEGQITMQGRKRIGYLDQYQTLDESLKVKTYLHDVFADLFDAEAKMESLYEAVGTASPEKQNKLLNRASAIGEMLVEKDFYAIKSQIGSIIHGLGLTTDVLNQTIETLSSGMRSKVILAKLLLEKADVLLLDEPTNFLDVAHIEWLANFLNQYDKSFIVVSHHNDFLRKVARTVYAIESGEIIRYKGSYDNYLVLREERKAKQQQAYENQQAFIERTETFIKKNIAKAKSSTRAKSRRKMLNKLKRVAPPKSTTTYKFNFPVKRPSGEDVLSIDNLEIGYDTVLIDPISFEVKKGDKLVITGKNGIGKSTLVKTLIQEIDALGGHFQWSDTVSLSYFEQDSQLPGDKTPFEMIREAYPDFDNQTIFSLLGGHGLDASLALRKLSTLSGGEKAKTRLAILRHRLGNVLIADEPTNHLDEQAKSALKDAFIRYEGTLILVSHEPSFYQDVCDYEITLYNNGADS